MKITKKKLALVIFIFLLMGNWHFPEASLTEKSLQQDFPNPLVTVKTISPDKPVVPGDSFVLQIELNIAPAYHINSQKPEDELLVPTSVEIKKDPVFEVKEIIFPEARKKKFKFSDQPLSVYEGKVKIKVKIELAEDLCGDNLVIEGKVRYQACNQEACLRPSSAPFKLTIPIS